MTLPGQFLLLVLVIAAAAAAMMVPRSDEWLAMMRDDRKHAQIVALLEPKLAREGDDPSLLATLGRAHADLGDTARAIELLERYVALRPQDADAHARLAGLYGATGETARQIAALNLSVALAPKLARVGELATLYRSLNKTDAERALLTRFEAELSIQSGLLLRLAQLYTDNGEPQRAIAALSRADVVAMIPRGSRNDDERLLLGTLLAETGQGGEAVRLGKLWIKQWRLAWLANRLLLMVAPRVAAADAFVLADAVADLHPDIRLYVVKQLAEHDAAIVAQHLLKTWRLANPRPSMDELAGFLSACREWGEPVIVWEAFEGVLRSGAAPTIVARYANAIAAEFGIGSLAPFWSAIPTEALERMPLLVAQLAFAEGDSRRARSLIAAVDVALLDGSDQRVWADLLTAVASPQAVLATMRTLHQSGGLPRTLLPQYAQLAGSLGHEGEYQAALAALRGSE